ncbi:MAG: isoleucine--tRNA ligase [Chloroflexi bacterium]|nr:isoleucine--tRNA ligase [Chloroflexota bacterium]
MFTPVSSKLDLQQMELEVLEFWQQGGIFRKSTELRAGGPRYVFYEGPPTANGKPGSHHVLARAFKDIFPRYQAMRGKYVLRRGGWDTHGLPVEIEVEKQLGLTGKEQIEKFGIAEFNARCRQSAFEYIQEWERLTDRIGFWVDLKTAYVTYENNYIESVWWILRQLWDKQLVYRGFKVVPYCPRCGTALSDHEVALGYQDDVPDPSVYVRMRLKDDPGTALLVWTTTPWTLPANVACAVGAAVQYVTVELPDGQRLILARELLADVLGEGGHKIVAEHTGAQLAGLQYLPLYSFLPFTEQAHFVVTGEFVTTTDGTGIVHLAPAYGAEDMQVARTHNLPVLQTVDARGCFIDAVLPFAGMWVKDADPLIIQDLQARQLLHRAGTILHTYPFCWRCNTALLYYARDTWYVGTTRAKEALVSLNQTINWYPDHVKNGRFGNWLEHNVDWALGRERYWGTPLPIWMDDDGDTLMVGSVAELSQLAGKPLDTLDLHRPHVDAITFANPKTGKLMRRVPEVIDCWFDSGAMPVAQWHYPFENKQLFDEQFPADYICEAVDQTRGWFYSLHAISALLFGSVAYKNVACLGLILDGEGQKMSKSKGNIVNPWDVLAVHGADAFRWYLYTASPPGQERRFSVDLVGEVVRNFTLTLWNTYAFFVSYANLDGWQPAAGGSPGAVAALTDLDRWILSELHTLVGSVTTAFESYDVTGATRPIERFVYDLSNWYVRRSRRRFWKSGAGPDKQAAYATLHECLLTVSKLLAPSMPFIADAIYRNLAGANQPESVHLTDWPVAAAARIDPALNHDMQIVQRLVSLGHSARQRSKLKVRQPLPEAAFWAGADAAGVIARHGALLADELNVKQVRLLNSDLEAVAYELHALPRELGQKYGSRLPAVRTALAAMDAATAARTLLSGQSLALQVDGIALELLPAEVEVRLQARSGFAVAAEGGLVAALVTDLTPELVREGLAREVVRRVQELRKSSGFQISDRIRVRFHASTQIAQAIAEHHEYIAGETLAVELRAGAVTADPWLIESESLAVQVELAG